MKPLYAVLAAILLLTLGAPLSAVSITTVGDMTTDPAFGNSTANGHWLGLGASAGRILFQSGTPDIVNIKSATLSVDGQLYESASTDNAIFVTRPSGNTVGIDLDQSGLIGWTLQNRATSGDFAIRGGSTDWLTISNTNSTVGIHGQAIFDSANPIGVFITRSSGSSGGIALDQNGVSQWQIQNRATTATLAFEAQGHDWLTINPNTGTTQAYGDLWSYGSTLELSTSAATDALVVSNTTNTSWGAYMYAQSGNGTTSSRKAASTYRTNESSPQKWTSGMCGTKDYQIFDDTASASRLSVASGTGGVTIGTTLNVGSVATLAAAVATYPSTFAPSLRIPTGNVPNSGAVTGDVWMDYNLGFVSSNKVQYVVGSIKDDAGAGYTVSSSLENGFLAASSHPIPANFLYNNLIRMRVRGQMYADGGHSLRLRSYIGSSVLCDVTRTPPVILSSAPVGFSFSCDIFMQDSTYAKSIGQFIYSDPSDSLKVINLLPVGTAVSFNTANASSYNLTGQWATGNTTGCTITVQESVIEIVPYR